MSSAGFLSSDIIAIGTTQATCLTTGILVPGCTFYQVGTCTSTNNGVLLPANQPNGTAISIRNDGAYTLNIYPPTGLKINDRAANIALQLGQGLIVKLVYGNALVIYSFENCNGQTIAIQPAVARTMLPSENGLTLSLNAAAASVITLPLPTVAVGVSYKFIRSINATGLVQIDGGGAGVMCGNVMISNGSAAISDVTSASCRSVNFATTSLLGDYVEVRSNGTLWVVSGQSSATASLTFTEEFLF
jgi:hypothetical protein